MSQNTPNPRPLGVAHLVFGLVFTGIAAIWLIGEANDTDVPDLAIAFPAVLIGAGLIGLVATLVNHGRAKKQLATAYEATATDAEVEPVETTEATAEVTDDTTPLPSTEKDES